MEQTVSWVAWSRNVASSLTPSARLVLFELARLADERGVAVVLTDHLELATGSSKRTVIRALAALEKNGLIVRERSRDAITGRYLGTRIQLLRKVLRREEEPRSLPQSGEVVDWESFSMQEASTGEGLRTLIKEAMREEWEGEATAALGAALATSGPRVLSRTLARRRWSGDAPDQWDTLSIAWEVIRENGERLIAARSPWALLADAVSKACARADEQRACEKEERVVSLEALGSTGDWFACEKLEAPSEIPVVGIDEFGPSLGALVTGLHDNGVPLPLAHAMVARTSSLLSVDPSRRVWAAARDQRLADLGVTSQAARALMSTIAGPRRVPRPITDLSQAEIRAAAKTLAESMKDLQAA